MINSLSQFNQDAEVARFNTNSLGNFSNSKLGEAQSASSEREELQDTVTDLSLDWDELFEVEGKGVEHVDAVADALILSLTTRGCVDIEYISSITGESKKDVILALKGSIYQNPDTWNQHYDQGWETAEEYLSGNLMRKLKTAREANKLFNGYFQRNIDAIKKVLPPVVKAQDIYVTLGSPWLPADIIDDFIMYLFGNPYKYMEHSYYYHQHKDELFNYLKTVHDEITGSWEIPNKGRYNHSVNVSRVYGTKRLEALHILERTLNMKTVYVTDEVSSPNTKTGTTRVINKDDTVAAIDCQKKLINAFQDWVWKDEDRKARLEKIYERKFGSIKRRVFDGSFLKFPGLSEDVHLFDYQKNAVARILFTPNTLLAHDVGAGKTYVMIAAGQELRRMGLSKKNMYVVPNNIVGQWASIFRSMYQDANLLVVEPKTFTPDVRAYVLKRMRDEDFDGIIIAYSCFEEMPISLQGHINQLEEEKKEIAAKLSAKNKHITPQLLKKVKDINKKLDELNTRYQDPFDQSIYFDDLKVNRLFVDEAHNFKNVPIDTKTNQVLGISSTGSNRCKEMLEKVRFVQRSNNGKGVVFATGTPITNSVTDCYIMQQYLQSGELALLDLHCFDAWIGMFAEKSTAFEIDVDTSGYRLATRFNRFHNLPELTALLSQIADFHQLDASADIPQFDGYQDKVNSKSIDLEKFLKSISERADIVRKGQIERTKDNMLKITSDGRKAALDIRLVDPTASYDFNSKVARCAENVSKIYFDTYLGKKTQLIFCDTSTPKQGFNIYDELKTRLIELGVAEDDIAFVHDANTDAQREKLFKKVRSGEIRVLIGSTFKLGIGVNVQDRLIAIHHIDVPWRPADMTQREGRILRQGNTNDKVYIYRYITEGSFDAYSWQLLETKQRFIQDLLSGSIVERSGSEIDDIVLNYAEVKALAVGNPAVKTRCEKANELTRLYTLQHKLIEARIGMQQELLEIPTKIENERKYIAKCKSDLAFYKDLKSKELPPRDQHEKDQQIEKRRALREFIGNEVRDYVLETSEKTILEYKGFKVVLPANMTREKPYCYLVREGKYYVELGDTDVGNLARIDNFIDNLQTHLDRLNAILRGYLIREADIKAQLEKDDDYTARIEELKREIENLDRQLGATKK